MQHNSRHDSLLIKREALEKINSIEVIERENDSWCTKKEGNVSYWYQLATVSSAKDTPEKELVKRSTFFLMCSLTFFVGIFLCLMYIILNKHLAATILFLYSALNGSILFCCAKKGFYSKFVLRLQLCLILCVPHLIHFVLGGLQESGGIMLWSFLAPLGAAYVCPSAESFIWFQIYLLCTICRLFLDSNGSSYLSNTLSANVNGYWAMNITGVTVIIFFAAHIFSKELEGEYVRSEELLHNILPCAIAGRIRGGELPIIDNFDGATILFADLVGFTKAATEMCPNMLIGRFLRDVFSHFDRLVERRRLEKIKTIGDAYMVVAGLEPHDSHHTVETMYLAREMFAELEKVNRKYNFNFQIRVGIHTGPVIAGVIGVKKFAYGMLFFSIYTIQQILFLIQSNFSDVWGNAVNTASRMESHGIPGYIHISQEMYCSTHDLDDFEFTCKGESFIKGLGNMTTYIVNPKIGNSR